MCNFIPLWVLIYGLLAWFSAEILTSSTNLSKIDLGTFISLSLYIVQIIIAADVIVRRKLSFVGILVVGVIFGLFEETFFIKNPFPLNLLLSFGHSAITVTIPFIAIKLIFRNKLQPFLSKRGYAFAIVYLGLIYTLMAFLMPFIYIEAITTGLLLIIVLVLFLRKLILKEAKTREER